MSNPKPLSETTESSGPLVAGAPEPAGGAATAAARDRDRLTIRSIELVPLNVPLETEYRGSYYGMTNRATIVTRVVTEEGIVGEAYAGDEDRTLGEIAGIIRDEITPRLIGQDAFAYERCWELGLPSHLRSAAGPAGRSRRAGKRRPGDLGCDRQGAAAPPLAALGRLPRHAFP